MARLGSSRKSVQMQHNDSNPLARTWQPSFDEKFSIAQGNCWMVWGGAVPRAELPRVSDPSSGRGLIQDPRSCAVGSR